MWLGAFLWTCLTIIDIIFFNKDCEFTFFGRVKGDVFMLVSFLNVFMCPMIALAILYRITKRNLVFSAEFLVNYGILCVCNMPITKFLVVTAEKVFDMKIELYSTYYTMLAIVAAVIMPYLAYVVKTNVSASVEIRKNDEVVRNEQKIA